MDDPWDVKSVRRPGLYTSCMKINGVPLLPPVLSKECRKEMQYYKLLAKEVEKRISILQPYIDYEDSNDDKTDASEMPECEQLSDLPQKAFEPAQFESEKELDRTLTSSPLQTDLYNTSLKSKVMDVNSFVVDLTINDSSNFKMISNQSITPPNDVPERDYNCTKSPELQVELSSQTERVVQSVNYSICVSTDVLSDAFPERSTNTDGPASLGSKNFTGSLNNIHIESNKDFHSPSKLLRQRSYTLLNPSPQLLAHLEVQSLNTGVEMSCISMSDSLNSLTPNKKRRSWDLETAKVKWSNMAKELKQKNMRNPISPQKNPVTRQPARRNTSPQRAKSVAPDRTRPNSLSSRSPPLKSEPAYRARRPSPVRVPTNKTIVKEPIKTSPNNITNKRYQAPASPKTANTPSKTPKTEEKLARSPPPVISESDDPATKVRELYEKIQKQQLVQMASLVEKQKREQIMLQQVFEEQNNLLFKQLKTICPMSPVEAKEAWGDKNRDENQGPVSLSQLINQKPRSPDPTLSENLESVLNDSNKYINHCNNILMKSRDISKSNGKVKSPSRQLDSKTRKNSPNPRASRQLNYDTSSSNRDYEPILTDRTNDTMADLNITFPSDSEDTQPYNFMNETTKDLTVIHTIPTATNSAWSTDSAIKCMERTIQNSINNMVRGKGVFKTQPTTKQLEAASIIVAYAKGFLVRRLMRTARVQATVQTIKDALVCALQLHQDREGIRGADVDLHRRLIQQITAACYALHDTFITSTATERCALIAADRDRSRRASFASRPSPKIRHSDIMSQSHSGVFPSRPKAQRFSSAALMTQSNYESYSNSKSSNARYMPSPRRRPWR